MKDKNTTWHGIDVSKEVSLLEYNLLVRWDRSKQSFQCIYKIGMDRWGIAFMANREIDQIIMEEWFDLGSFQSFGWSCHTSSLLVIRIFRGIVHSG